MSGFSSKCHYLLLVNHPDANLFDVISKFFLTGCIKM